MPRCFIREDDLTGFIAAPRQNAGSVQDRDEISVGEPDSKSINTAIDFDEPTEPPAATSN